MRPQNEIIQCPIPQPRWATGRYEYPITVAMAAPAAPATCTARSVINEFMFASPSVVFLFRCFWNSKFPFLFHFPKCAISTIDTHAVRTFHKLVRRSRVQFWEKWIHSLALAARAIKPAVRTDPVPGLAFAV